MKYNSAHSCGGCETPLEKERKQGEELGVAVWKP